MKHLFRLISARVSQFTGSATAFVLAIWVVIIWAASGPFFDFSPTWQLVINTSTTIVTFLMVFLIQNTQNRDTKAIQLKLDELLNSSTTARRSFIDLEDLTDGDLEELDQEFKVLREKYAHAPEHGMHKLHKKIVAVREKRQVKTVNNY